MERRLINLASKERGKKLIIMDKYDDKWIKMIDREEEYFDTIFIGTEFDRIILWIFGKIILWINIVYAS